MRIISGSLKGKLINFIKNSNTRPLKDSVRENIFNILKHSKLIRVDIEKSNILDLYSGIGSFGIESISRGAKKVTFIEKDFHASNMLEKNLKKLAVNKKYNIYNDKIENFLESSVKEKFDIFFFDPPFADFNFYQNLELIKKIKIYKKNHIVIIHREKKSKDEFKKLLNIIFVKEYGRSKIFFGEFI
tara:strand:- start:6553 stop:7113 length:561 start_codon:yes stop_codon:yes gene_type:complete